MAEIEQSASRKFPPALIGGVVLAAGVLAFVFQNTQKVRVEWLFFDWDSRLWILLLVTAALSIAAGELVSIAIRRARKR